VSTTRHSRRAHGFDGVVIVGSQGALRSGQILLSRLPPGFPTPVVFDLHRGEDYGILERVLGRECVVPVQAAAEGMVLMPSTIYLAPHDRQLLVGGDRAIRFGGAGQTAGHPFADALLVSAARALGPRLIAVVLSGRLNGGAEGVREVKRLGGRVLVEDPATADAPSMPNAALATGCVDFMLPADGVANALVTLCAAPGASELFRVRLNAAVVGCKPTTASAPAVHRLAIGQSVRRGGNEPSGAQPAAGNGARGRA
jgi:two-component system, chemotaxis family, protein-glutamate methylesterase/glutaminase